MGRMFEGGLSDTFGGSIAGDAAMLMSAADYRESLRRYKPRVFVS